MPDEMEFGADLVTVSDENGQDFTFEILDRIEDDKARYVAMVPYDEDPTAILDGPQELIILRVNEEDGETYLEPIEDEAEFARVAEAFEQRLTEEYEFEILDDEELLDEDVEE